MPVFRVTIAGLIGGYTVRFIGLILLVITVSGCSAMMVGGGNGASTASRTAASSASDSSITAAVRSNLAADAAVSSFGLGVRTDNGKVILSGTVNSYTAYDQAERVTIRTDGVKSIENHIQVEIIE